MIYSGNLTETLDFYRVETTQSASGFKEDKEVFKFKVKAQRLKNKEYVEENAGEVFHLSSLTFKMRKRDIDETDIVVYEGQRYMITSIDEYRNEQTIIVRRINE